MTAAGFPHSDTLGSQLVCQLPEAYRRLPRPSSAPSAKASTVPLKTSTHYNISQRSENQSKNNPPQNGGSSRPVLNIWDARVHCAVLKQRTTRRHPARLPPQPGSGSHQPTTRNHQDPRTPGQPPPTRQTRGSTHPRKSRLPQDPTVCLRTRPTPTTNVPPPNPEEPDPEEPWCVLAGRRDANPILLVNVPPMSNHQTHVRCLRWSA